MGDRMTETNDTPLPTEWPQFEDPTFLDKIIDIIASEGAIDRDAIVPTATLETLGLASMDVMMILMGVEEKLDVYLPMDAELAAARNLAEFTTSIARNMQASREQAEVASE